jgi:hypothetical protein
MDLPTFTAHHQPFVEPTSNQAVMLMGDKSPKAKEKSKKQDTADKNQKKSDAKSKAAAPAPNAGKKK